MAVHVSNCFLHHLSSPQLRFDANAVGCAIMNLKENLTIKSELVIELLTSEPHSSKQKQTRMKDVVLLLYRKLRATDMLNYEVKLI